MSEKRILVGVSSCLLGEKVRFDSGHKKNAFINNVLSDYFDFRGFCPEVSIGLGVPRPTLRLVLRDGESLCISNKDPDLDVTDALRDSANAQYDWHKQLHGYILKKDSPSCGMERVRLYKGEMPERNGVGIYAQQLMKNFPYLPVEEEGRLGDPILRENFIQRVFIYYRWQQMCSQELEWKHLTGFHARHKYILMSHDPQKTRELGSYVATNTSGELAEVFEEYLRQMMQILKKRATKKSHSNTLAHLQGYLKKHLSSKDKEELVQTIDNYRNGLVPLIVPMTLLKHHFMHHPNEYITQSYYLAPYPEELMLLNQL